MRTREKLLLGILISLILLITGVYAAFRLHKNKYSEYDNKTYLVKSNDGKISGTIKTHVTSCSEFSTCVHAKYDLILNDYIPRKTINRHIIDNSYFDPNYFYAVNLFNNDMNPHEYSFDSNLKPINESSNQFLINFEEILYGKTWYREENSRTKKYFGHDANDIFKLRHIDIYDMTNPSYVREDRRIDSLAPLKNADKIKSYDFNVIPQ